MAVRANPRIDLTLRNQSIRSPLNPTGETPSLLDPGQHLSYNRWSVSIVYDKTAREGYSEDAHKGCTTTPQVHCWTIVKRFLAMMGHGRIVIEKVTFEGGYEIIDADANATHVALPEGRRLASFRKHINFQRTLNTITGSIGPLFKNKDRVQAIIDFIQRKIDEGSDAINDFNRNEPLFNPPLFDVWNPNPAENVFNCITFAIEAANIGGVNFYPLLSERIIPRVDIRPIEELAEEAIEKGIALDPEIREYMDQVETKGTISLRNLSASLNNLVVLMSEGPHVFKEYKRLLQREGLSGELHHPDFLKEARGLVGENDRRLVVNEAVRAITYTPLLCVIPVAVTVECCYARSVKKKRDKEALVRFFKEE